MEAIAIGSAVVGAFGDYKAGKAQQEMYRSQAAWSAIQGETDALNYEQQGVNALKKTLRTVSTITARAAAGNINPWAGSTGSRKIRLSTRNIWSSNQIRHGCCIIWQYRRPTIRWHTALS